MSKLISDKDIISHGLNDDYIEHWGIKGMKWGYEDGIRNGKRVAEDILEGGRRTIEDIKNNIKLKLAEMRSEKSSKKTRSESTKQGINSMTYKLAADQSAKDAMDVLNRKRDINEIKEKRKKDDRAKQIQREAEDFNIQTLRDRAKQNGTSDEYEYENKVKDVFKTAKTAGKAAIKAVKEKNPSKAKEIAKNAIKESINIMTKSNERSKEDI